MQVQNGTQSSLLAQAKQGDPKALRQLMGVALKRKGIAVTVDRKGALLYVSLAARPCPPKKASLSFLEQGLAKLELTGIDAVRVSGHQTGDANPLWVERLALSQSVLKRSNARYMPQGNGLEATHPSVEKGVTSGAEDGTSPAKDTRLTRSLLVLGTVLLCLIMAGLIARTVNAPGPNELPDEIELQSLL